MSRTPGRQHGASPLLLSFAAFLIAAPNVAFSQTDRGAPAGAAYFGRFDSGRGCLWRVRSTGGHLNTDQPCVAGRMPADSYADNSSFGPGWHCIRGSRAVGNTCARIILPPSEYSVSNLAGRVCDRDFRPSGTTSGALPVPPLNRTLAHAGDEQKCERRFTRRGGICMPPPVYASAQRDSQDNDGKCAAGFDEQHLAACNARRTLPRSGAILFLLFGALQSPQR
jgi:hypothetical protein